MNTMFKANEDVVNRIRSICLQFNFLTIVPFHLTTNKTHRHDNGGDDIDDDIDDGDEQQHQEHQKFQLFNIPSHRLVFDPRNITHLNLSHNKINSIDGSLVAQFSNLIELNLYWNQIMTVPEQVFTHLKSLKVLNLGRNKIVQLSSRISELTELEELDLSFNMIAQYPDLSQLTRLRVFLAYAYPGWTRSHITLPPMNGTSALNKLVWKCQSTNSVTEWFNEEAAAKQSLRELDLSFNAFAVLPDQLHKLSSVVQLHLCHCQLSELPPSFSQMTALRNLYLRGNRFTDVPSVVCQLVELRELDLSFNKIKQLSDQIGQLVNLSKLGLAMNPIEQLPSALSQLTKLELLRVGSDTLNEESLLLVQTVQQQAIRNNVVTIDRSEQDPNAEQQQQPQISVMDRIRGCLFGQLIGDAMGLGTEFMDKNEALANYGIEELRPEHFFANAHLSRWVSGDYTDDSDQMLLIMDSLLDKGRPDYKDFANRLFYWIHRGYNCLGMCVCVCL